MLEKVLSKIPDKVINGAILAGMLILFSGIFCLLNHYDTSYDYIFHSSDYTRVTGVIRNTYSRGRPKYAKFYADVEYEWNGESRKLTKTKKGLFDRPGKEIVLYVKSSTGQAVRGITVSFMDIVYVLLCVMIICRWVLRTKRNKNDRNGG